MAVPDDAIFVISMLEPIKAEAQNFKLASLNMIAGQKRMAELESELRLLRDSLKNSSDDIMHCMAKIKATLKDIRAYYAGAYCARIVNDIEREGVIEILNMYERDEDRAEFIRGLIDYRVGPVAIEST